MAGVAHSWIAGPYIWTYNSRSIGITQDGFRLSTVVQGDTVRGDNLGDSDQDYVNRGGNVSISGILNEWDVALNGLVNDPAANNPYCASIFWPWAVLGATGQVGRMHSLFAAPLIGTPAPNTTAATASVKSIALYLATIPPGTDLSWLYAARLRDAPLRLVALPTPFQYYYDAYQVNCRWFSMF